jgi:HEAT repeat protein
MIRKIFATALFLVLAAAVGASFAGPSPKKLAQQMNSADVSVRLEAAKQLRGAKKSGKLSPIIAKACGDPDADVRAHAYYAISKADAREEGVVQALIDGMADTSVHVRRAVAASLGGINPFPTTVLPYMVKLLIDPDERVRSMILASFADMQGLGIGALMRHIDTKDDDLRLAVVNTLGAMGPGAKGALQRLQKLAAEDKDQRVKEAAQRAVKNISR